MRLEVRCCCNADQLLGTLDVPEELAHPGGRVRLHVPEPVEVIASNRRWTQPVGLPLKTLELDVCEMHYGRYEWQHKLAVKADGVPIETLRRLPSFEPA